MKIPSPGERWRITFEQLCHACGVLPNELEAWSQLGAFGPRWKERRQHGKWRHVDRTTADRAVLMSRLVHAGVTPDRAAVLVRAHTHGDDEDLVVTLNGVTITIKKNDLP